jgi:Ca2+-transporting ATPase
MAKYHSLSREDSLKQLKTTSQGLNRTEADHRLKIYGKNQIKEVRKFNALKILVNQIFSFLIIILIIAAIISALTGHMLDFYVIMAIVVLNSAFGFVQEYKAEKAIQKLKAMLVPKTKVLRNNTVIEIDSREVAPGDILVLSQGDKVMADARIIASSSLQINEAPLTGESMPVDKHIEKIPLESALGDRVNMIYQGTQIVRGNCRAVVASTGMNTEYGKIAGLVQKVEPGKNPLKKRLDIFARNLAIFTFILLGIIVILGLILGFDKLGIFLTAVSLVVSVIPEGLPAVITISLALVTQRMLKTNTLIRKLPASETLGRTSVICADKTGTITEEKMQVKTIYLNKKIQKEIKKSKEADLLFKIGILCNNARIENENKENEYIIGDPTEKALLLASKEYGISKEKATLEEPRVKEFSFSSTRKMMSIVRGAKQISYVKGAPEMILARCNSEFVNGRILKLTEKRKQEIQKAYEELASKGMRVLGFAYKNVVGRISQQRVESNLIFVGLQGMIDPPRPEVKKAVEDSNKAGIKVKMITGDSLLTALEVGKQIGFKGKAINSENLRKMTDHQLSEELKEISIFARVTPEDKLRIVTLLKEQGEIVAVTGDGVNDAPALKKADIGIAVNRGTDVAKDSSDMILLDNNFASISKAVKEGRRVYDNIKKFIKFLLAANFYEVFLVLSVILIWRNPDFLPLLPLQILWINLVTDSFPALALSQELAEKDIMSRLPGKKGILSGIKGFILVAGILGLIISFLGFFLFIDNLIKARTMAVTVSIIFQMFLAFNCKSNKTILKSNPNKYLIYGVLASVVIHVLALYTPIGIPFQFVALGFGDWLIILALAVVSFLIIEGYKLIKGRKNEGIN